MKKMLINYKYKHTFNSCIIFNGKVRFAGHRGYHGYYVTGLWFGAAIHHVPYSKYFFCLFSKYYT